MEKVNSKYKLYKRCKDPKFSVDDLHDYALALQIGQQDLQFLVTSTQNNRCLFLEDFLLKPLSGTKEKINIIKEIFDNHHLLRAGFWKSVSLTLKSNKFSIIPNEFFDENLSGEYLKYNCTFHEENETHIYHKHESQGFVVSFPVYANILDFLSEAYPTLHVKIIHQVSALYEGIVNSGQVDWGKNFFLIIDRFCLHMFLMDNSKLIFYNQFHINEFADYERFIKIVVRQFKLNLKDQNNRIWGYFLEKSRYFQEFKRIIPNLKMGSRPSSLKYGYIFDETQEHQYIDTFGTYFCQ